MAVTTIDALGKPCPMPVVLAKQALDGGAEELTVLVDNEIAVENLKRLAESMGGSALSAPRDGHFAVAVRGAAGGRAPLPEIPVSECVLPGGAEGITYLVTRDHLGDGDPELGGTLMKMFLYTLSQSAAVPRSLVFLNGGVRLAAGEEAQTAESLKALEEKGSKLLVCGTCLNFYGLTGRLGAGKVSNMYDIVEELQQAGRVVSL